MDHIKLDKINTGDVIISTFNSLLGYGIRVFTDCEYNHIFIAVRIDPSYLPKIKILKKGGLLCVLENKIGATHRNDKYYHLILRVLPIYEHYKFLYRPLKKKLYTDDFYQKMTDYIYNNTIEFLDNDKKINYISDVIGHSSKIVPHSTRTNLYIYSSITANVCSEVTYSFYKYCFDDKINYNRMLYAPKHFLSPNFDDIFDDAILLGDKSNVVMNSINYCGLGCLTLILIIFLIIVSILYVFSRKKYKKLY